MHPWPRIPCVGASSCGSASQLDELSHVDWPAVVPGTASNPVPALTIHLQSKWLCPLALLCPSAPCSAASSWPLLQLPGSPRHWTPAGWQPKPRLATAAPALTRPQPAAPPLTAPSCATPAPGKHPRCAAVPCCRLPQFWNAPQAAMSVQNPGSWLHPPCRQMPCSYATWMVAADACALTCGRCLPCTCTCTDVPPDGQYTCAQQASAQGLGEAWPLGMWTGSPCARGSGLCLQGRAHPSPGASSCLLHCRCHAAGSLGQVRGGMDAAPLLPAVLPPLRLPHQQRCRGRHGRQRRQPARSRRCSTRVRCPCCHACGRQPRCRQPQRRRGAHGRQQRT